MWMMYIYNTPTNFPYRIGTPRCSIKRFFNTGYPKFELPFLACFGGLQFYFGPGGPNFLVPKFSDPALQF